MSLRTQALHPLPLSAPSPGRLCLADGRGRDSGRFPPTLLNAFVAMAAWAIGGRSWARPRPSVARAAGQNALSRFEEIVLPHLDAAYTLAVYLCRDRDAAEDVVQEAFLKAFRGFEGFRGEDARPWLLAIVRNCHLSWRQELRRRSSVIDEHGGGRSLREEIDGPNGIDAPTGDDDPELVLVRQGEAQDVRAVLADLPEAAREILVLRDVEDLSYRDIAKVLDLPVGTVMSRLARARKSFASRWRVRDSDGGAA